MKQSGYNSSINALETVSQRQSGWEMIFFQSVRARRGQPTLPYIPGHELLHSAQLSCHDAPIFRLLLKIAVSLTASNVTFSIFVRLRAANNTSINKSKRLTAGVILVSKIFIFRSVRTRRGQPTLPYITRRRLLQSTYLAGAGPRSSRWLSIG